MTNCRIIAKRHNNSIDEIVTHVKVDKIYQIETIIKWIEDGTNTFYTEYEGNVATVYVKVHPISKKKFLISKSDRVPENNLDYLPNC